MENNIDDKIGEKKRGFLLSAYLILVMFALLLGSAGALLYPENGMEIGVSESYMLISGAFYLILFFAYLAVWMWYKAGVFAVYILAFIQIVLYVFSATEIELLNLIKPFVGLLVLYVLISKKMHFFK